MSNDRFVIPSNFSIGCSFFNMIFMEPKHINCRVSIKEKNCRVWYCNFSRKYLKASNFESPLTFNHYGGYIATFSSSKHHSHVMPHCNFDDMVGEKEGENNDLNRGAPRQTKMVETMAWVGGST